MNKIVARGAGVALALGVALSTGTALACLWDSDTLRVELKGLPNVVQAITGRFERNPPLYYEMRLARVSELLKTQPDALDLYDDAAVACDRLGRDDEAIAWMARKLSRLDVSTAGDAKWLADHRYRTLANLGTFHAHRWFKTGADRTHLDDLRTGRDMIAQAIALNPDAHFGREAYQLKYLDAVLAGRPTNANSNERTVWLDFEKGKEDPAAAIRGLTGLIMLGNAWESVDVFNSLSEALDSADHLSSPACLAYWRASELSEAGKFSAFPGEPLYVPQYTPRYHDALKRLYPELREEAEAWHAARVHFMEARLAEGKHPDTDRDFWSGYHDPGPPEIEETSLVAPNDLTPDTDTSRANQVIVRLIILALALVVAVAGMIAGLVWLVDRSRRGKVLRKADRPSRTAEV